jgi:hypothetical protein
LMVVSQSQPSKSRSDAIVILPVAIPAISAC